MSIRTRITLVGLGIVTLVICCLSASLFGLISSGVGTDQEKQLATRADEAAASLATAPAADFAPHADLAPIDPRTSTDTFVMVVSADASVLSTTAEVDGAPIAVPAAVLAAVSRDGRAGVSVPVPGGASGETVRLQVRPWTRPDLGLTGYVVAGQTSRRVSQNRAALVALFIVSGAITFVAAASAVWVATGRALRPLRQMAVMADEVGRSQDLGRRLPAVTTRDAVGRLTTSFNAMMDRLQEAYGRVAAALAAQQRFTADASHELRTPLTTIRNNAEFLLAHPSARPEDSQAALADIAGEAVRMSRLVENLLTLARADSGVTIAFVPIDVAEVAESVCRQAAALHPDRVIRFTATPARSVSGDADMVRQLVWILVDNAVKFTPPGGGVWVAVTQHGTDVLVTVADDGIGIPAGATDRIFDRFYRADPSRSGAGAGLGLAIAAWVVREHGGTVVAANNDRGGATVTVQLPGMPAGTDGKLAIGSAGVPALGSGAAAVGSAGVSALGLAGPPAAGAASQSASGSVRRRM
jgi:two-component system, OmpR family, sensor kinase